MLLLLGKNYKVRNIVGTNIFVGESNEKMMNLLLHYTERSQNIIFHTDGSTIAWIQPQKIVKDNFNYIYHVTMPRIFSRYSCFWT